jgi:hypothetical protein
MSWKLKPDRGLCLDAPSANPPKSVGFPSAARRIPHRAVLAAIAMVLVSAAIVIAYAALLPQDSLPSSAPALGAVLLASTLSSIAGFAFSAICGAMLLHSKRRGESTSELGLTICGRVAGDLGYRGWRRNRLTRCFW